MVRDSNASSLSLGEKETSTPLPELSSSPSLERIPAILPPLDNVTPEFKAGRPLILAFISLCIITLAAALDATSLSIALPIITEKLHGTAIEAFWSGTSFLVTSAVFQPVIAALSHGFGRKNLILISSLFFAVGCIIAAVATNFTMMLVGRSIQGIGGGGILTLGEILITDLVPLSVRGAWFGYLGSMWALGSVTGPLIGGALAQNVSWRWIFWINIPLIGVGSLAIFYTLVLDKLPGTYLAKARRFDWIGSVLFIGSTVSVLIPMTWGGVIYPWNHWRTLFPLLLGAAGMVGTGFYEHRLTIKSISSTSPHTDPIIRFTIFSNTTLLVTFLQTLIHGVVLWSLLYYLPLYYEGVKGYTPIISGVAILPETSFVAPMSVIVGITCAATGRYRWALWIGWVLTTIGAGLLTLLKPSSSIATWVFLNVTISIGTGMVFAPMALAVQAASRPQDVGHAVAFYAFLRVFGQSMGVAIGGVVFQNQIKKHIAASSIPALASLASEYSKDATGLVKIIADMADGEVKTALVQAFSDSLKMIWVVMCVLSGVGLIASIFTKGYSLVQVHNPEQGLNAREKIEDAEAKV